MSTMTMGVRPMRSRSEDTAERNRDMFELQRRARRGPTPEVFFTKHLDNSRIVKADDPERRREMRLFTIVMSVLFSLVMIYVWQHFSAIEMGYQIEAQKNAGGDVAGGESATAAERGSVDGAGADRPDCEEARTGSAAAWAGSADGRLYRAGRGRGSAIADTAVNRNLSC